MTVTAERPESKRGLVRRLGPLVLMAAVAAAVGVVAVSGFESVNDQPAVAGDPLLGQRVPSFTTGLQLLVERDGRTVALDWPLDRVEPNTTRLHVRGARFNADGSLIGGLGLDDGTLHVGTADTITPVNADTLSYLWHDSDALRIASIRFLGGDDHQVFLGERQETGRFVFTSSVRVPENAALVGYGDWGIAITTESEAGPVVSLFGPDGALVEEERGRVLWSGPGTDGGVVVATPAGELLALGPADPPACLASLAPPLPDIATCDPAGVLVAAERDGTVQLMRGESIVTETAGFPLQWLDHRRLMLAEDPGITVLDVEDGSVSLVSVAGRVIDAIGG